MSSSASAIASWCRDVGSANTATSVEAFRWTRQGTPQRLAPLPGDSGSEAFGINIHGEVVGYSSGHGGIQAVCA